MSSGPLPLGVLYILDRGQWLQVRECLRFPGEGRRHRWVTGHKQPTPAWGPQTPQACSPQHPLPVALGDEHPQPLLMGRAEEGAQQGQTLPSRHPHPCAWHTGSPLAATEPNPTHAAPRSRGDTHGPGTCVLTGRSQDRHVKGTGSCLRRGRGKGWVSSWGKQPCPPTGSGSLAAARCQARRCRESRRLQGQPWAVGPGFSPFPNPQAGARGRAQGPRCHPRQPLHCLQHFTSTKGPLCLARRAGHDPALGNESPCATLASGSLCSHSPVWCGRALCHRCPLLVPPFLCRTCCWWKEKVQLLHQHRHGSFGG